jgi:hypothetical protein
VDSYRAADFFTHIVAPCRISNGYTNGYTNDHSDSHKPRRISDADRNATPDADRNATPDADRDATPDVDTNPAAQYDGNTEPIPSRA